MASLRRSPNSPFWIACLTLPCGMRTNRSTKTTDRRLALRLADEWQTAADKAREGRLVEAQAREVLNDILESVGEQKLSTETVEVFLQTWLKGKDNVGTVKRYSSAIELFLRHLGPKRHAMVSAIGHTDILGFMENRMQAGVASKTLSVDVRILQAAFNVARKLGCITSNPVERALTIRPIAVTSCGQRACFTPQQVSALLDVTEGDWKTAILLGYYTGARLGDCAGMCWENVNLSLSVIDFLPKKTRRKNKRVIVPIHPMLLAHLQNVFSPDRHETYFCPTLAGKSSGGKNGLSAQFQRIMNLAGIDPRMGDGQGKLSFHSLRHSFNSALANNGVDQETRMRLTGHRSAEVNDKYTHLELPKLRAAVEKLPSLVSA